MKQPAPVPLLAWTQTNLLSYHLLERASLEPLSRPVLLASLKPADRELGNSDLILEQLVRCGHLLEQGDPYTSERPLILSSAGEAWLTRFYLEHRAALAILRSNSVPALDEDLLSAQVQRQQWDALEQRGQVHSSDLSRNRAAVKASCQGTA